MDRTMNDVIPIASRRPPASSPVPRPAPPEPARRGGWGVVLVCAVTLLVAVLATLSRVQTIGSIRNLPQAERAALYRRTFDDTRAACGSPDAAGGALREHCLRQAEFLRLFPECDDGCQKLTAAILPHARR